MERCNICKKELTETDTDGLCQTCRAKAGSDTRIIIPDDEKNVSQVVDPITERIMRRIGSGCKVDVAIKAELSDFFVRLISNKK